MNIIISILFLIFLFILALLATLFILLLIYMVLNFSYKFVVTIKQSVNPSYHQRHQGTPKRDTTYETHKVVDFVCSFLHFWSPFKKIDDWAESLASRKHIVQNRNNPSKNSSKEYAFNNSPQISSKESIETLGYKSIMGTPSHADNLPQEKDEINHKQTEPMQLGTW